MVKHVQPTIWLDTTTIYDTLNQRARRPTGISRVALEFLKAARSDPPRNATLGYVRYDRFLPGLREVSQDEIKQLLAHADAAAPFARNYNRARQFLLNTIRSLPIQSVQRLVRLRRHGFRPIMIFTYLMRRAISGNRSQLSLAPYRAGPFRHPFAKGDVWINLGGWWHGRLPEAMAAIRAKGPEVTSVALLHDCIPLLFPELCTPDTVLEWYDSLDALFAGTDVFLANSECTKRDILDLFSNLCSGKQTIRAIHLGDSVLGTGRSEQDAAAIRSKFGLDEPYVLVVGTIEARKNHALVFRAWRSLLRKRSGPIPRLVFAGRWGWKTRDLRDQIKDSNGLTGALRVLEGLSDDELDAVFRGALFTIMPSLYEGWGLPVRESHGYGKVCVAARNSALTEAGGDLAIYFENDCQQALVEAVESLLDDPKSRTAREDRIRSEFVPVSWRDAWREILGEIEVFERSEL